MGSLFLSNVRASDVAVRRTLRSVLCLLFFCLFLVVGFVAVCLAHLLLLPRRSPIFFFLFFFGHFFFFEISFSVGQRGVLQLD